MTSKQVTSPPWNSRRLVHSKEMAWASRWSVALRAFYKQILSSSNCKDFFFKWHRPPRKLAKEVFVKFIPAKEKTRFAKEWRKVLAKDHVIRIDSHEVFNTAHLICRHFRVHSLEPPSLKGADLFGLEKLDDSVPYRFSFMPWPTKPWYLTKCPMHLIWHDKESMLRHVFFM